MKIYALTSLGKKVIRNGNGTAEELCILEHLWNYKTATDEELDKVGEGWLVRRLARGEGKLIKELTN